MLLDNNRQHRKLGKLQMLALGSHVFVNYQLAASQHRSLTETTTHQLYCRELPVCLFALA